MEQKNLVVTDTKKQLIVVYTACLAGFMAVLDSNIVNVSLPAIAHDFNVSMSLISRVVIVYYLMLTSTLLLFGKLEDLVGVKRVFLAGYLVFTLGSLLCGLSVNLLMLVASRCVQGLGGAILGATMVGVITRFLPPSRKGWGFGLITTAAALGVTLGAPLGGFITAYASWHWIFLINIPIGIMAMVIVHLFFPEDHKKTEKSELLAKLDFPGILFSFISLSSLLCTLNMVKDYGWASPVILGLIGAFVISFTLFYFREKAYGEPLLDLSLFKSKGFTLANLSNLFAYMFLAGGNFLMPFYLSTVKGLGVSQIGLLLIFMSISLSVMSPLAGKMSDRVSPRFLTSLAMLILFCACTFFLFSIKAPGLVHVVIYLILQGISFGLFLSPNNTQATGLAPAGKQGTVSGVIRLNCNLGQSLGVAVMGTIFSMATPHGFHGCPCPSHVHVPLEALSAGFLQSFMVGLVLIACAGFCALFSGSPQGGPK